LSLTGASNTLTLANLFTFGGSSVARYDFALIVTGGAISGWQFGGFINNNLVFNPSDGGYDGNTVAVTTSFGAGPNLFGNGTVDNIFIGTGCSALGTAAANCTSVVPGGANTSTFSELTVSTTAPEPSTELLVSVSGLVGLAVRSFFRATGRTKRQNTFVSPRGSRIPTLKRRGATSNSYWA
jgi:hypothetical protein